MQKSQIHEFVQSYASDDLKGAMEQMEAMLVRSDPGLIRRRTSKALKATLKIWIINYGGMPGALDSLLERIKSHAEKVAEPACASLCKQYGEALAKKEKWHTTSPDRAGLNTDILDHICHLYALREISNRPPGNPLRVMYTEWQDEDNGEGQLLYSCAVIAGVARAS